MDAPQFDIIDVDAVRERDMASARKQKPMPTWFVVRMRDNMEFACEEKEAYDIINNTSTWKERGFKFIGYSDGKTYQRVIQESIGAAKVLEPEIAALQEEFRKYRSAEESLLVNEGVDMDDHDDPKNEENVQKILRLRKIIDKIDKKLAAKNEEFRMVTRDVVKKATAAEREVAVENWKTKRVWPGRVNIITPDVNQAERDRILATMAGR